MEVEGRVAGAGEAAGEARAQGKWPGDCWGGRLRGRGVSGAVGKGRGHAGPVTCCLNALSVRRPPLWHSVNQVVGTGTLPFAVPRLRSSVHDNVLRYDDMHSNLYTRVADQAGQGFDSDGLALVLGLAKSRT